MRTNAAAHQALSRRVRKAPQRHQRNAEPENRPGGREAEHRKARDPETEAYNERPTLAEPLDGRADNAALHHNGGDSDARHSETDGTLGPAIAIHHIQHADGRQSRMGKTAEEVDARE